MLVDRITDAPHVPRIRAFLDARAMIRNPVGVFEKYRKQLGPTYTVHLGGGKAAIVSTDPSFVQHVLQKNWANYHMSDIRVRRMGEFQGKGLINSHGKEWMRKRRFLAHGFRPERLAEVLPMQEELVQDSLARFDLDTAEDPIDIHHLMVGLTFRLGAKALFGSRMTDSEVERMGYTINTIQAFILRQIVQPYKIPWFRISGQSARYQRLRIETEQIARDFIAARRREVGEGDGDLLEYMLVTPYPESDEPLSEEQVLIESLQLLVASNETTTTALTWTLYLLGRHPRFIGAMRDEMNAVLGSDPITFKGLHQLRLTLRVLDEAMRLYPSFWMIDRKAVDDDEVGGIHIPAGLTVLTHIYGMHRNTDVWEDPEVFDPSRFEDEAKKHRNPFAHLPFGGGPRKCIGSSMAFMQILLILTTLLRRYDFELVGTEPVDIDPMMILHQGGVIGMRVRRVKGG